MWLLVVLMFNVDNLEGGADCYWKDCKLSCCKSGRIYPSSNSVVQFHFTSVWNGDLLNASTIVQLPRKDEGM